MQYKSFRIWLENKDAISAILSKRKKDKRTLPVMQVTQDERDIRLVQTPGASASQAAQEYKEGFTAMVETISDILTDDKFKIPDFYKKGRRIHVPWGHLFNVSRSESTPEIGSIEIEYSPYIGQGKYGDVLTNAIWLFLPPSYSKSYLDNLLRVALRFATVPVRIINWVLQKVGIGSNMERVFVDNLHTVLASLSNEGRLVGLEQWDIRSSMISTNLIIKPKPEYSIKT